jgi:hypothetical protein
MHFTFVLSLILCCCTEVLAKKPHVIRPGINLAEAKAVLAAHGYEMDALKYGLAMAAGKAGNELEFSPIDANITLVIEFQSATKRIESLGVVVIPDQSTSKLQHVTRSVLEIAFYDDGIYTLKLKRVARRGKKLE